MTESRQQVPATLDASLLQIRPAITDDVDAIFQLIDETSANTTILARTRDDVCEHVRDFCVCLFDEWLIGCGALAVFTRNLAEVRSIIVAPQWRRHRIGSRIVSALVEEARRLGIRRVFALTDNPRFFQGMGFSPTAKESFPYKVWNDCTQCPKLWDCQEVAVELILGKQKPGDPTSEPSPQSGGAV